jgi:hypothetical protein
MASLLEQDQYEKVAALYIFQMNVNRALEVLNEGLQRGLIIIINSNFIFKSFILGGKEEYATLILALVGFIRATSTNSDDKTLINDFSPVTKLFQRPYVRAMFAFILTQDGNDIQYECVLVKLDLKKEKRNSFFVFFSLG